MHPPNVPAEQAWTDAREDLDQLDLLLLVIWDPVPHFIADILPHQPHQCLAMWRVLKITGDDLYILMDHVW